MAKKATYIQGATPPQKFSDGEDTAGVTGFWHIRKSRTKSTTLCGMNLTYGLVTRDKRPKDAGKKHSNICTSCDRIAAGKDPVFDGLNDEPFVREEHHSPDGRIARTASPRLGTKGRVVA